VDLQPALAHGVDAVALDQLLLDVVEEVGLAPRRVVGVGFHPEPAALGRLGLRAGDHPEVGHLVQDVVTAAKRRARVAEGVVDGGRLREPGQQRRLVELEVLHGLVEEDPRGGGRADGGGAPDRPVGNVVEVLREDPGLRVLVLDLLGELGLPDLALERPLPVGDVEVADELHRDRRAALHRLARAEVLHAGADDALVVDSLVPVEAAVLHRHRGIAQRLGEVVPRHGRAQLVGGDEPEPLAVGRVDRRGGAVVDRLEGRDGRR
jgi:hypothetical protein